MKVCTFIVACREFFGLKPGQTLQEFAAEIRQLTPTDKSELTELFKSVGYDASKTV